MARFVMAKSTVSHRLDGVLLERADVYAKARGVTRSVLIEEGLRALLDLAEGGVPDLPAEAPPRKVVAVTPQGPVPVSSLMAGRQARLNKEMGW
jgi:hypothetical protein